ncbi:putative structural protein [Klebsiella pneumoniae]|uniref:Putative structural protein n=1 Tax=Klebsiella pneumoniae TaxID=573 RepID=A0A377V475_KLEPN|nr:putative structural protein [Klebsiella pneumoniae]
MMSLWDALRMNMMISYQELVRTFLSVIDRWLNERIKDKVMLLIVGLQIDPVVTNNTAEAAVALLLGNRLTQEALDPSHYYTGQMLLLR